MDDTRLSSPFLLGEQALVRALCADLDQGVILHAPAGSITYYNAAAERILQMKLEHLGYGDVESRFRIQGRRETGSRAVYWQWRNGSGKGLKAATRPWYELGDSEKAGPLITVFAEEGAAVRPTALADENTILQRITDPVPARISSFDRRGRNLFANAMAERVRGYAPGGARGASVLDIMGWQWLRKYHLHIEGALAGREQRFSTLETNSAGQRKCSSVRYLPRQRLGMSAGFFAISIETACPEPTSQNPPASSGVHSQVPELAGAHLALQALASDRLESGLAALNQSIQLLEAPAGNL